MSRWPHDGQCERRHWLSACSCLARSVANDAERFRDAQAKLAAVQQLIDQAQKVSPSDRMTVYVGDLLHALGMADQPARTRTGANG